MVDNVLVTFSGGIDSFYVALKELEKGNNVTIVHIEFTNNSTKTEAEKYYLEKWGNYLKKKYPNTFYYDGIAATVHLNYSVMSNYFLIQPLLWLIFGNISGKFDRMVLGTIIGDDVISYKEEFTNLFNAVKKVSWNPDILIDWSYSKTHKYAIWQFIKKKFEDGFSVAGTSLSPWMLFWTCETPKQVEFIPGPDWEKNHFLDAVYINHQEKKIMVSQSWGTSSLTTTVDKVEVKTKTKKPKKQKPINPSFIVECGNCLKCHEDAYRRKNWC